MRIRMIQSLGGALFIAAIVAACGGSAPSSTASPSLLAALPAIQASVTSATGYPAQAIELLAGPAHLRLSISDAKLAGADQATREAGAADIVAAVEKAMASRPELAPIQEISIAIVHPEETAGAARDSHVEDVLQFRKGPNQRFSHHIT
jgi:hypothetical protein